MADRTATLASTRRPDSFWNQITGQTSLRQRPPGGASSPRAASTGSSPASTAPAASSTQGRERSEAARARAESDGVALSSELSPGNQIRNGRSVYRLGSQAVTDSAGRANEALGDPSSYIQAFGRGAGRVLEGVGDFLGGAADLRASAPARGVDLGIGLTRLGASGLDWFGAPEAAERLRQSADTASRLLEPSVAPGRQTGQMAQSFFSGIGDGAGGLAEGLGTAVANPVSTVRGLTELALTPMVEPFLSLAEGRGVAESLDRGIAPLRGVAEGIGEQYRQTGEEHGGAAQWGRGVFDVGTILLTGGAGAGGRVGLRATANVLDDFSRASGVSRGARAGGRTADELADAGRASEGTTGAATPTISGEANRFATSLGDFSARRLGSFGERIEGLAGRASRSLTNRVDRLDEAAEAAGGRRAGGGVRGQDAADLLTDTRQAANALGGRKGSVATRKGQWEAGGAGRQALIDELPAPVRERVQDLVARGQTNEALHITQRQFVDDTIRSKLETVRQVDEMYPTRVPEGVDPSRVLATGREGSLRYLLDDASIPAENLARDFRHLVDDSELAGPAFIQQFRQGEQIGRGYSSGAGRATEGSERFGGYYSPIDNASLSRGQSRAQSALPQNNPADRFARIILPEDMYGVVTQIGEKYPFGPHATGGGLQYTFPLLSDSRVAAPVRAFTNSDAIISNVGRVSQPLQQTLNRAAIGQQGVNVNEGLNASGELEQVDP